MPTLGKPIKNSLFIMLMLVWALLIWPVLTLAEPPANVFRPSVTVAIDPGHGGHQHGARGPTGILEKTVALELARLLALDLEPAYQVVLIRSDDYHVDLHQRTAIANHAKADLMISLHAAAGYRHTAQGRTVYYHLPPEGEGVPKLALSEDVSGPRQLWKQVQAKHAQASRTLADIMKVQFDNMAAPIPCHILGAPLVVLSGADMPAILIEVGHITHPKTEKELSTPEGLALLAKAIHKGIDHFIRHTSVDSITKSK